MIRLILKRQVRDGHSGVEFESYITIDCDVPQLEEHLGKGGYSPDGYDITNVVGAEILEIIS